MNINGSVDESDLIDNDQEKLKKKNLVMRKSAKLIFESLDDDLVEKRDRRESLYKPAVANFKKKCAICYKIARRGEGRFKFCPFRLTLPNFYTF